METISALHTADAAPTTLGNGATPVMTPAEAEALLAKLGHELGTHATVDAVFGQPRSIGERTVIPVARLAYGFGGGVGSGKQGRHRRAAQAPEQPEQAAPTAATAAADGFGFGGGGGLRAEPVAVVEIGPKGLRVVPVVDANRLIGRVFAIVFGFAFAALVVRAVASKEPGAGRRRSLLSWVPRPGMVSMAMPGIPRMPRGIRPAIARARCGG
jgi:uncharacterized spore protein YtfJ